MKNFLEDNSLIKEHPPESIIIWKKYLIYGAALGVADKVYESMKLQVPNISDYDNDGLGRYTAVFTNSDFTIQRYDVVLTKLEKKSGKPKK